MQEEKEAIGTRPENEASHPKNTAKQTARTQRCPNLKRKRDVDKETSVSCRDPPESLKS